MFLNNDLLSTGIARNLSSHHKLYRDIKVRDYLWEYVLHKSISDLDAELLPSWDYGSQKIGKDITLVNGLGISCKSGLIHNDERIKISSSRLSRFEGDRERIKDYLSSSKTEDYTYCLSTRKGNGPGASPFDGFYTMSVFDKSLIDYQSVVWGTFGKDCNLVGVDKNNAKITVTVAMGWQAWYYVPTSQASFSTIIAISDR